MRYRDIAETDITFWNIYNSKSYWILITALVVGESGVQIDTSFPDDAFKVGRRIIRRLRNAGYILSSEIRSRAHVQGRSIRIEHAGTAGESGWLAVHVRWLSPGGRSSVIIESSRAGFARRVVAAMADEVAAVRRESPLYLLKAVAREAERLVQARDTECGQATAVRDS